MANKKLGTVASELRLPNKKDKSAKKPKWQAKTGNKKGKDAEVVEMPVVVETQVQEETTLPPEPTEMPVEATTPEVAEVVPAMTYEAVTMPDVVTPTMPTAAEDTLTEIPATSDEPSPKKPRKFKAHANLQPKKLSMIAAALQVLQERKVPMTCPELIDVMATEGLWASPGGKTPANTLYAAFSRIIKEKGEESAFRKAERGRFEAVIMAKE